MSGNSKYEKSVECEFEGVRKREEGKEKKERNG